MNANSTSQGTSLTQDPASFISWAQKFVAQYEKHFSTSSATQSSAYKRFMAGAVLFFEKNAANQGQRYYKIFRNLGVHAAEDQGILARKIVKIFFEIIEGDDSLEKHRLYILRSVLELFNDDALSEDNSVALYKVFKEQCEKLKPEWVDEVCGKAKKGIQDGQIVSYNGILLYTWLATKSGSRSQTNICSILDQLVASCPLKSFQVVNDVISDYNEPSIYRSFAAEFLKKGFSEPFSVQQIGFGKLIAMLKYFSPDEIHDILFAFCESWKDKEAAFFCELEQQLYALSLVLQLQPTVGKAFIKFFKKHKQYVRTSVFGLSVQIMLASFDRYEEVLKMLSSSFVKLWMFASHLKNDGWVHSVMKDLKLGKILEKLMTITELIRDSESVSSVLCPGLVLLSLQLIEAGAKKLSLRVTDGRLEDSQNEVSFVGRWLLVQGVSANLLVAEKFSMRVIVDFLCQNCHNPTVAFLVIDALVEMRSNRKVQSFFVTHWDLFSKITHNISKLDAEIGVRFMAALMPVINQRKELRKEIFDSLKDDMISPAKVANALPVMLQLLRSLVHQQETKNAFQCSQSFATFSSQLSTVTGSSVGDTVQILEVVKRCLYQSAESKCHVYKGMLNICKKNNFFVVHCLDLLVGELQALPTLRVNNYLHKSSDSVTLKFAAPFLVKTTNTVLGILISERDVAPSGTQTASNGFEVAARVEELLCNFVEKVCATDLEDMELDRSNEHIAKNGILGKHYRLFGYMMVDLYDVIAEHLWTQENLAENRVKINQLYKVLKQRQTLIELFEGAKKGKTATSSVSHGKVSDLQIDFPRLSFMLESLSNEVSSKSFISQSGGTQDVLVSWLLARIRESTASLDPSSTSCLVSLSSLTNLASALFNFIMNVDGCQDDSAMDVIKVWFIARTLAYESYSKVILYMLAKYGIKCADALASIFERNSVDRPKNSDGVDVIANLMESEGRTSTTQSQGGDHMGKRFQEVAMWHILTIYNCIICGIFPLYQTFDRSHVTSEYQKQLSSLLAVARKLTSMLPADAERLRYCVTKAMLNVSKHQVNTEKQAVSEYWEVIFEVISQSSCQKRWFELLRSVVANILVQLGLDIQLDREYTSITTTTCDKLFCVAANSLSSMLARTRMTIDAKLEMGDQMSDDFLCIVCATVEMVAQIVLEMSKVNKAVFAESDSLMAGCLNLISDLYVTLRMIVQRFAVCIGSKTDLSEWESIKIFDNTIAEPINQIVEETNRKFGELLAEDNAKENEPTPKKLKTAKNRVQQVLRKAKRDEKLFTRFDKEFELFHVDLILLESKIDIDGVELTIPAAASKSMRDFRCNFNSIEAQDD